VNDQDVWHDPISAAGFLDTTPAYLAKLRWQGGGPPFYRLSGIRYRQRDLDAWRESRRRTSTSDRGGVGA